MLLYSSMTSSPLDRSKRFTLFLPWQTCSFQHQLVSPGSILVMQQLRAKTKSLTFPPLSIARYSFVQLSEMGRRGENENAKTSKR